MKNILYGLLATLLFSNFTFAQLMSDEDHRIMMNAYATNLNSILTSNCPVGITLDQYKRGIVNGTYTLNSTLQTSISNYAASLKTYGTQFASTKGLSATTDALKYFYSTFSPSTQVQGGKLVESTTTYNLTATAMWICAVNSFGTDNCGSSSLVSDKYNLNILANASVSRLTTVPTVQNMGTLVMLTGFNDCINSNPLEYIGQAHNLFMSYSATRFEASYLNHEWDNIIFLSDAYKTKFATIMNDVCHSRYPESTSTISLQKDALNGLNLDEWFDGDTTTSLELAESVLVNNATSKDKEFTMNLLNATYTTLNAAIDDESAYASLENLISQQEVLILSQEWNSNEEFALGTLAVLKYSTKFWKNYNSSAFATYSKPPRKPNPRSSITVGADIAGYVIGGVVGGISGSVAGPAGTVGGVLGGKFIGAWAGSGAALTAIGIYDAWDDWFKNR